jgi:hypothetical protein
MASTTAPEESAPKGGAFLSAVPDDLAVLAQALIENGCQSQLDLLIDTTPEAK